MEVKDRMRSLTKALASLSVGIVMVLGLVVLMPDMGIGILAGYIIGIASLVLTSELIDRRS